MGISFSVSFPNEFSEPWDALSGSQVLPLAVTEFLLVWHSWKTLVPGDHCCNTLRAQDREAHVSIQNLFILHSMGTPGPNDWNQDILKDILRTKRQFILI